MKNFGLPKTKRLTGYTWIQLGITSFTGNASVENHLYNGESLGAIVHFNARNSIWIQETFNKGGHGPVVHDHQHRIHLELVVEQDAKRRYQNATRTT
jgi:hypothetical protein